MNIKDLFYSFSFKNIKKHYLFLVGASLCLLFILFYNSSQNYQIVFDSNQKEVNQLSPFFLVYLFIVLLFLVLSTFSIISLFVIPINLNLQFKKLIKSDYKFKAIYEHSAIGFAFVDANSGFLIDVNPKFCELLEYNPCKLKNVHFTSLIHHEEVTACQQLFDDIKKGIVREYIGDKRYVTQSGKEIWVNLSVSPLWIPNETPTMSMVFIKDISSDRIAQKLIEKGEKRFENLLNTIEGIVWKYNIAQSNFSFISKQCETILGYSAEEWKSNPNFLKQLTYAEDWNWVNQKITEVKQNQTHTDIEYRMWNKEGKIIWIRNMFNFIKDKEDGDNLKGIIIDITKMKEIETDLKNSFNLITEQNKKLLNFSYIISHNLRSHTSNIESISDLIDTTKSKEENEEMIELLKSASNSLNETIYDLNNVVNVNTKINLVLKPLNLKQYVSYAEQILAEQIQQNNASIIKHIPDELIINYNPACLENILYNLISNALRFKHPERNPIITLEWTTINNQNCLILSDNGIGIDLTKNSDSIFGMYKTFNQNMKSSGMGLFTTKNQIEAMGGKITVDSVVNEGTNFKIYFQ